MSKDQLQSLQTEHARSSSAAKPKRNLSFLLPLGLVLGFLVIFALLFGKRLLPAVEVQTTPVITLRAAEEKQATSDKSSELPTSHLPEPTSQSPTPTSSLLFQASGWIEPDPYITIVPTLQNGVIDEVQVLEGDTVKKGSTLATLVADDAKLDLQQAERKIDTIGASIAAHCSQNPALNAQLLARKERVSAEESLLSELKDNAARLSAVPVGAVPVQEVTQAKHQVERQLAIIGEARAEITRIESEIMTLDYERITMGHTALEADTELQRAQLALDRTTIKAPMDGIVLRLHVAPGKKRMLNMDDPLSATIVELYDPQKLQARIDVPLNEAAQLSVGQPVLLVTDLLPNTAFKGTVTRLVGEADLQRNTLQAKVQLHNPDQRLRPGMLMRAKFYAGGKSSAKPSPGGSSGASGSSSRMSLYAPSKALLNTTETTAQAWVANDGHAERRDLTLGSAMRDDHHHVLTGLRSGEQLILPPHDKLKEGTRIKTSSASSK
jgi:HlyD family secretion protein